MAMLNNQRVKAMFFWENIPFQKQKTDDSYHLCLSLQEFVHCTFESTITTEMLIRPENPGVFNRNHFHIFLLNPPCFHRVFPRCSTTLATEWPSSETQSPTTKLALWAAWYCTSTGTFNSLALLRWWKLVGKMVVDGGKSIEIR